MNRSGFFLVIVLVVVAVATMAVYSFTELMVAYDDAAYVQQDLVQARVSTESGAEAIRVLLAQPLESRREFGGLYRNPQLFQAIGISAAGENPGLSSYSVLAPDLDDVGSYGGIRFGLQNESARLNLNTLTVLESYSDSLMPGPDSADSEAVAEPENLAVALLLGLPGMTLDIADAILDWMDADEEPRPFGAEAAYYTTLSTPYAPPNGPLQSVEELLLVRGVTPTLLFGADANRNGVLDADEQQRFGITVQTPGALGWAAYLTVHGAEANKRRDGSFRVDVNEDDLELLYEQLLAALDDELFASYIVAYRIAGSPNQAQAAPVDGSALPSEDSDRPEIFGPWQSDLLSQFDLSGGAETTLSQVLELVDSTVTVGNGDDAKTYSSPFAGASAALSEYLPLLMDAVSTQSLDPLPGRININECPVELLRSIPWLEDEAVEQILELRETESEDPNRQFATWLLVEGIVSLDRMQRLQPLVTGGGDVFRAQIVGYSVESGAAHRCEVIVDATTPNPKVVSWRDLSHLGRGFDLSVLGARAAVSTGAQ